MKNNARRSKLSNKRSKIVDVNSWDDILSISNARQLRCVVPATLNTIQQIHCLSTVRLGPCRVVDTLHPTDLKTETERKTVLHYALEIFDNITKECY